MELPLRKDVPIELTWDLTLLYPTEEAYQKELDDTIRMTAELCEKYRGKLNCPGTILDCLDEYEQIQIRLYVLGNYAELGAEVDYNDSHLQEISGRFSAISADLASRMSFIDSEILANPDEVISEAIDRAVRSKGYLKDLLRSKPHMLSPETEKALTALTPALMTSYNVYNMNKMGDIRFEPFTANGKEYPLGYSLFEDDYEYTEDTQVRRNAFRAFSDNIRKYEYTNAELLKSQAVNEKIIAGLRGYDSVFDFLLFDQKVSRSMYDRQIDLITQYLAPHMQKYARLIGKIHHLDKVTYADLKLPVDPDFCPPVTLEQAKKYCMEGLFILGPDYVAMIREAFENRWFDLARNEGKATGGFCASPYGKNSYILLSFNGRMSDVFTMAHELGHAGHFASCNSKQSLFDTNVSNYLVESPSTMNELLMAHHLLKTSDDKRFRRWVLSSMISNTYYHNFVTHLREAWFQREYYKIVDEGGSFGAEVLDDLFRKNLEIFWGDAVELTGGAELTWMRQPHYYMGLYPYTYSAGLTLATEVCRKIETEGQPAVDRWKNMLAAGSTADPMGLAAIAGVDLSTDGPLMDTIAYIGEIIDEIEELSRELGDIN